VVGIGPGSFEYWWARDDVEISGFVRDAHSLYLEAFGELGVVGLLLIASAVGGALGVGIRRVRRADSDGERAVAATATAAMLIFAAAAAIDWAWELTVLPVTFLLLAAALIGPGSNDAAGRARSALVLPLLAGVSLIAILPPILTEIYIEDSQDAAGRGELVEAIENARSASAILPFDASSHLQQALVLQLGGDLDTAAAEARVATERESTNWRTWLVLSRIEADRGNEAAAELALEQSRRLNPRSLLFQEPAAPSG
jgi:tetratricopeptide (TPR) repeat protein